MYALFFGLAVGPARISGTGEVEPPPLVFQRERSCVNSLRQGECALLSRVSLYDVHISQGGTSGMGLFAPPARTGRARRNDSFRLTRHARPT